MDPVNGTERYYITGSSNVNYSMENSLEEKILWKSNQKQMG